MFYVGKLRKKLSFGVTKMERSINQVFHTAIFDCDWMLDQ